MQYIIKDFGQEEWGAIIAPFQDISLMQTWEYGQARAGVGGFRVVRGIFQDEGRIVGAVQLLCKRMLFGKRGVAFANRGPLWRTQDDVDPAIIPEMIEAMKRAWVDQNGMYLRVAPALENATFDPMGNGWQSARIDLRPSLDAIRENLGRKWRGSLSHAQRQAGMVLRVGHRAADFLNHFESVSKIVTTGLLQRLHDLKPLYVCDARAERGEYLGGLMLAEYGDTALALAGSAPNERGRQLCANHLIWWQCIQHAKQQGYRWLDVGGMGAGTPEGILRFKQGLGGVPYQMVGEIDISVPGYFALAVKWQLDR